MLEKSIVYLELDELYWFIERKAKTKTRENVYILTVVSREPRQIEEIEIALDRKVKSIQSMVDRAPQVKLYCSDGYSGYSDVNYYFGTHIYNKRDKSDTYTVEG